jgi:hypothetical protein
MVSIGVVVVGGHCASTMTLLGCRIACRRNKLRGVQRELALVLLPWCHAGALRESAENIAKAVDNSVCRVRGYILDRVERWAANTAEPDQSAALRLLEVDKYLVLVGSKNSKHGLDSNDFEKFDWL